MARLIEGSYELSLDEIKGLTGWPDEMAEDYSSTQRQTRKTLDELDAFSVTIAANKTRSETNETNIAADFKYLHGAQAKSTTFSATASYNKYDLVTHDGNEYSAKQAITPAAFNPAQWRKVSTVDNTSFVNEHIDAPDPHPQYAMKEPSLAMFGTVGDITIDPVPSKLSGYTGSIATQGALIANLNTTSGEIEITAAGTYKLKAYWQGTVGTPLADEVVKLVIDIEGVKTTLSTSPLVTSTDTDKALSAEVILTLAASDTLSLYGSSTANLGVFTTSRVTFEVTKIG